MTSRRRLQLGRYHCSVQTIDGVMVIASDVPLTVASRCVLLASDEQNYITGQVDQY